MESCGKASFTWVSCRVSCMPLYNMYNSNNKQLELHLPLNSSYNSPFHNSLIDKPQFIFCMLCSLIQDHDYSRNKLVRMVFPVTVIWVQSVGLEQTGSIVSFTPCTNLPPSSLSWPSNCSLSLLTLSQTTDPSRCVDWLTWCWRVHTLPEWSLYTETKKDEQNNYIILLDLLKI